MEMKLYEITEEMHQINDLLEESGGEMTPALESAIDRTSKALVQKCDGVASYARMLSDQIEMVNKRKKEIDALEKRIKNQLDGYKGYVLACMERADYKKVEGPFSRITLPKRRMVVEITDEDKLDEAYFKPTIALDKRMIKDDLEAGLDVTGARLVEGKQSILIKMK